MKTFECLLMLSCLWLTSAETPASNQQDDDEFPYEGRIVGGYPTSILNFPYQVSLQYYDDHICGGSVVAANIIVTAAHCVEEPLNVAAYKVRAGSSLHRLGGQLMRVRRIIRHEEYASVTHNYDVAIVVLAKPLTFSEYVQPVQLAALGEPIPERTRLYVSGWGLFNETGSVASMLRFVSVRYINQRSCVENYKLVAAITPLMFCAGNANGGRDSCQGDSGGPLAVDVTTAQPKLVGIVSWGVGCGLKAYPGVYTRVSEVRSWIDGIIAENSLEPNLVSVNRIVL